jgi:hypothetical protein
LFSGRSGPCALHDRIGEVSRDRLLATGALRRFASLPHQSDSGEFYACKSRQAKNAGGKAQAQLRHESQRSHGREDPAKTYCYLCSEICPGSQYARSLGELKAWRNRRDESGFWLNLDFEIGVHGDGGWRSTYGELLASMSAAKPFQFVLLLVIPGALLILLAVLLWTGQDVIGSPPQLPAPWPVEKASESFCIRDANVRQAGQMGARRRPGSVRSGMSAATASESGCGRNTAHRNSRPNTKPRLRAHRSHKRARLPAVHWHG